MTCMVSTHFCFGQMAYLKAGDRMPDLVIKNIINAPVREFSINDARDGKIVLLNFWGTWCSPCIPEMDRLAKLQKANAGKIRVIGISNDLPDRLGKYIRTKPSTLWLATDTSYFLYELLGLPAVGNCLVIGADKQIIAVLETSTVDQLLIDKLLRGESIQSNANILKAVNTGEDPFGLDSLARESFTVRGYRKGSQTKGQRYNGGPFAHRRVSWFNICATTILNETYGIRSASQVVYETREDEICDFDNKNTLCCVDLLVKPEEKDSLYPILQKKLLAIVPFKARIEYRTIPVYILKRKGNEPLNMTVSSASTPSYSFDGHGYDGEGVLVSEFASDYLGSQLGIPVIDETGLKARYDIKTVNELSTKENTLTAVEKLGLTVEKGERPVKVVVYSK